MAIQKRLADASAANVLKINIIQTITAGQVWRQQVAGVYHLIYPWILGDFTHKNDIQDWLDQVYNTHQHNTHAGLTTPPVQTSPIGNERGRALRENTEALGQVRTGLRQLQTSVADISKENKRKLV